MRTVLHRSGETDGLWDLEKQYESWSVDEFEYVRFILRLQKTLLSFQNNTAFLCSIVSPADLNQGRFSSKILNHYLGISVIREETTGYS